MSKKNQHLVAMAEAEQLSERNKMTFESLKLIRKLLTEKLEAFQDKDRFLGVKEQNTFIVSNIESFYLNNTLCLQEILHLLAVWDRSDIADAARLVFDGYRSIFRTLLDLFLWKSQKANEIAMKLSAMAAQQESSELGGPYKPNMTIIHRCLAQRRKEIENAAEEEDEERRKLEDLELDNELEYQARKIKVLMEKGEPVDLSEVKEPRLLLQINKEICKDLEISTKNQMSDIITFVTDLDGGHGADGIAYKKIGEIVEDMKGFVDRLNIPGIKIDPLNEPVILQKFGDAEREVIGSFSQRQRDLILRLVKLIQTFRPGMVHQETMTNTNNEEIEKILNNKEVIEARRQKAEMLQRMNAAILEKESALRDKAKSEGKNQLSEALLASSNSRYEQCYQELCQLRSNYMKLEEQVLAQKSAATSPSKTKPAVNQFSDSGKENDTLKKTIRTMELERNRLAESMNQLLFTLNNSQAYISDDKVVIEKFMNQMTEMIIESKSKEPAKQTAKSHKDTQTDPIVVPTPAPVYIPVEAKPTSKFAQSSVKPKTKQPVSNVPTVLKESKSLSPPIKILKPVVEDPPAPPQPLPPQPKQKPVQAPLQKQSNKPVQKPSKPSQPPLPPAALPLPSSASPPPITLSPPIPTRNIGIETTHLCCCQLNPNEGPHYSPETQSLATLLESLHEPLTTLDIINIIEEYKGSIRPSEYIVEFRVLYGIKWRRYYPPEPVRVIERVYASVVPEPVETLNASTQTCMEWVDRSMQTERVERRDVGVMAEKKVKGVEGSEKIEKNGGGQAEGKVKVEVKPKSRRVSMFSMGVSTDPLPRLMSPPPGDTTRADVSTDPLTPLYQSPRLTFFKTCNLSVQPKKPKQKQQPQSKEQLEASTRAAILSTILNTSNGYSQRRLPTHIRTEVSEGNRGETGDRQSLPMIVSPSGLFTQTSRMDGHEEDLLRIQDTRFLYKQREVLCMKKQLIEWAKKEPEAPLHPLKPNARRKHRPIPSALVEMRTVDVGRDWVKDSDLHRQTVYHHAVPTQPIFL
jgi:hypothetical protein